MPPTRMFALKRALLRWAGATVGDNARIVSTAKFHVCGKLEIGSNTWIGHEVIIVGGDAEVQIGAEVDIAPRVTIVTGSHEAFGLPGKAAGKGYSKPVHIGDGAWIGAGSTVLGGVRIGPQTIVAAGALVRKDTAPKTIVGGIPAKVISTENQ